MNDKCNSDCISSCHPWYAFLKNIQINIERKKIFKKNEMWNFACKSKISLKFLFKITLKPMFNCNFRNLYLDNSKSIHH